VNDALISAGKIAGSVILLAAVLFGVSRLAKLIKVDAEVQRLADPHQPGPVLPHLSICIPRGVGSCRNVRAGGRPVHAGARIHAQEPRGGLHAVERTSYGELLFAVSVALLFWLKDGHFISTTMHHKTPPGQILRLPSSS